MLDIKTKQNIYVYLRPLKTWIDNNGMMYLKEIVWNTEEYFDDITNEEIEMLLKNICDVKMYDDLVVTKINI